MYNAFNAKQFGEVDTDARFDFATGAQLNPNFGQVVATRVGSARVIQLGLRFLF